MYLQRNHSKKQLVAENTANSLHKKIKTFIFSEHLFTHNRKNVKTFFSLKSELVMARSEKIAGPDRTGPTQDRTGPDRLGRPVRDRTNFDPQSTFYILSFFRKMLNDVL